MRWQYSIPMTHRQQAWLATILFTILGLVFVLVAPSIGAQDADAAMTAAIFRVIGAFFLVLGVPGVIWMIGDAYLGLIGSPLRERWFWWGNFLLGIAGALAFALPATFVLPVFGVAYFMRPNVLFPPDKPAEENLWLAVLFSTLGIVTFVALFFIAREKYKQRPL